VSGTSSTKNIAARDFPDVDKQRAMPEGFDTFGAVVLCLETGPNCQWEVRCCRDDETLAIDLIEEVGPIPGPFPEQGTYQKMVEARTICAQGSRYVNLP